MMCEAHIHPAIKKQTTLTSRLTFLFIVSVGNLLASFPGWAECLTCRHLNAHLFYRYRRGCFNIIAIILDHPHHHYRKIIIYYSIAHIVFSLYTISYMQYACTYIHITSHHTHTHTHACIHT